MLRVVMKGGGGGGRGSRCGSWNWPIVPSSNEEEFR